MSLQFPILGDIFVQVKSMVTLRENAILITLPAQEPAQKLAELQAGLIYVLNDYFSHLGNEVDVEAGAAYNDLIRILQATMPSAEQLAKIAMQPPGKG